MRSRFVHPDELGDELSNEVSDEVNVRTGRCLCGQVRYELEGELPSLVNCHCQFCRRAHGAAFVTSCWVPGSSIRFTSGEEIIQKYAHGPGFRAFCGHCGTRLYNGGATGNAFITLIIGTLDEEPEQGPVMHINLESKASWHTIDDQLPQHETLSPEVEAAIAAARQRGSRNKTNKRMEPGDG